MTHIIVPPDIPLNGDWSREQARAFLASCPKRWVTVERTNDDRQHELRTGQPAWEVVGWNGWTYPVPKGRTVEVPDPIAAILDEDREVLRTSQARERRAQFTDIGDGMGPQTTI